MMVTRNSLNRLRLKRNRLVPILVLLASCNFLFASLSPVTAQKNGNVLPRDPLKSLLVCLDHAPFDFDKVEASAERGSAMQKTEAAHETTISPVISVLESVDHSKTLAFLGRLLFVGKHFEMAETGLETASELGCGFVRLIDLDKRHVGPLCKAVLFGVRLRRSRRRKDLSATVEALDATIAPLNGYEASGEKQNRPLA